MEHMVSDSRTLSFLELRCFTEVARCGGVTPAGDRLGLSKSVVSKYVSRLEQRLAVQLLERSSRSVKPTPEGARLLPRIESLIAECELMLEHAASEHREPEGLVRIAATPELGVEVARSFFPLVRAQLPKVRLAMTSAYAFEDLQDPEFDLAIRVGSVSDDRLVAHALGAFRRILVAAPDFGPKLRRLSDLERANSFLFSGRQLERSWTLVSTRDGEQRTIPIQAVAAIQNFSALVALAEAGQGVAYVPDFVAALGLERGTLIRVLPRWHSKPTKVYLVHRPSVRRVARVRAVRDLGLAHLPGLLSEGHATG